MNAADKLIRCTCPPAPPDATLREGDVDCPEHGLAALARELDALSLYTYPDGFKCFAATRASADRLHAKQRGAQA